MIRSASLFPALGSGASPRMKAILSPLMPPFSLIMSHGPVNGSRTPILMSSASADPNGKQAKPAASASHERARKKVCNCLVIDVLPPQRRFTELCRRLREQAALRDCCSIESTELSQPLVYDIGPCRYKKSRIVLRGCYGASR